MLLTINGDHAFNGYHQNLSIERVGRRHVPDQIREQNYF